ncbi:vWA-MoxR associated conflict system protein [Streptomyces sp. NPDC004726]
MTGEPIGRHVLVVAPQCASMERLERLDESAAALYAALTDASLGGCAPGLPGGATALLTGDALTSATVTATVHRATAYAAQRGAVLVLAFLGHGFVPGQGGTLRLMSTDSEEDVRLGSVNVVELLTDALDHPGIPGVLAVIDTCHAAGALPAAQDLTAGTRHGSSRLALLMGSSRDQAAVDLAFSRALTALLGTGIPGAGANLSPRGVRDALSGVLVGQNVTSLEFEGTSAPPLWIARNAAHRAALPGGLGGRLAHEELTEALRDLHPAIPVPGAGVQEAERCLVELGGTPPSPARDRALRAVGRLLVAVRTVTFLRAWIGGDLTTNAMRHALHTMLAADRRVPAADLPITDVAIVDELTFNHTGRGDGLRDLTRFVALLAHGCGKSLDGPELHAWGREIGASPALVNEAARYGASEVAKHRLALVVSLHSSLVGEWPETLDAWLLRDGSMLCREQFPNESADRRGAEAALETAAVWALDHARNLALPLKRLDIAAPSGLLLDWRPEEAGKEMLFGVRFDVRLHWSERLNPDAVLRGIEDTLLDSWETMEGCDKGAPVDWLVHDDVLDQPTLRGRLRSGRYTRGIGLTQHPGADARLLELLLPYTPVLLWPHTRAGFPKERHGCLDAGWGAMPEALYRAYRDRWKGCATGDLTDLADLRAVWDGPEWLRFCWFFRSAPAARAIDEGTV